MPAVWFPGAVRMPGRNAGYRAGRSAMRAHIHHYTVGVDSTGIGLDGYFHILMPKVGVPVQFAEIDAITWHAGEANPEGPGTELERLGDWEPATPDQIHWGGAIDRWLRDDWGLADNYFSDSAGRFTPPLYGFANHRNVQQSSPHTDYWSDAEVAAMRGVGPGPAPGPAPDGPVIYRARRPLMDFVSFRAANHWDTYRVDDGGAIVHSFYPWERGPGDLAVGNEVVGRDAKPGGNIDGQWEVVGGVLARTDLWVEDRDGRLAHYFQSASDWKWHLDGVRW